MSKQLSDPLNKIYHALNKAFIGEDRRILDLQAVDKKRLVCRWANVVEIKGKIHVGFFLGACCVSAIKIYQILKDFAPIEFGNTYMYPELIYRRNYPKLQKIHSGPSAELMQALHLLEGLSEYLPKDTAEIELTPTKDDKPDQTTMHLMGKKI